VRGVPGARAPRVVVAVLPIAVVKSLRVPVMVAKFVLQPAILKIATPVIVRLIAKWVNGVIGARATQVAAVVTDLALAIL